jgi:esterase/lipase
MDGVAIDSARVLMVWGFFGGTAELNFLVKNLKNTKNTLKIPKKYPLIN